MSFGTSIGDIIKILELAREVRKRFVDAPAQFRAVSSQVQSLSFLLEKIDDVLPHRNLTIEHERQLNNAHSECESILRSIQAQLEKFSAIEYSGTESKMKRFQVTWNRLRWDESQITQYHERLQLAMDSFSMLLQNITSDEIFKISQRIEKMEFREENQKESEMKDDILRELSTFDHKAKHRNQLNDRCDGTGQWFLESKEFKQFSTKVPETLVCHGIPGAGKTIIASTAIDYLEGMRHKDSTMGTAYFYFSYDSRIEQTLDVVFGSLAYQLLEQKLAAHIYEEPWPACKQVIESSTTKNILQILPVIIRSFSKTFIVLDALDEYHSADSHRAGSFFRELTNLRYVADFNLMVTTRYNSEIIAQFNDHEEKLVEAHKEDLLQYIDSRMHEIPRIRDKPDLQEKVRDAITSATDGMFLFARMHMDTLREPVTLASFKKCLSNLPRGPRNLHKMYDQTMARIEQQSEEKRLLARKILYWTIYTTRALSVNELVEALAIVPGSKSFDNDMCLEIDEIDSLCAGLVTIDDGSNVARLVHKTAQEYFLDKNHFPEANAEILKTCLTLMSYTNFLDLCIADLDDSDLDHDDSIEVQQDSFVTDADLEDQGDNQKSCLDLHFRAYAMRNWYRHIRPGDSVEEVTEFLLADDYRTSICMEEILQYEPDIRSECMVNERQDSPVPRNNQYHKPFDKNSRFRVSGAHLAAYLGLDVVLQNLVKAGKDVDSWDTTGRFPIFYSAMNGHLKPVKFFLEMAKQRWQDIIETPVDQPTFLNDCKTCGRQFQDLRTAKERKDIYAVQFFDSLCIATYGGHHEIVRELIQQPGMEETAKKYLHKEEVTRRYKNYKRYTKDALLNCCKMNDAKSVRLILEHWGTWVLDAYAGARKAYVNETGDKEILRILANKYTDDGSIIEKELGLSLIVQSAGTGQIDIIRQLLPQHSSQMESRIPNYHSQSCLIESLLSATERCHSDVVKFLLKEFQMEDFSRAWRKGLDHQGWYLLKGVKNRIDLLDQLEFDYSKFDYATRQEKLVLTEILLQVIEREYERGLSILLSRYHMDINSTSSYGLPYLYTSRSFSQVLIEKYGADPFIRGPSGENWLIYCAKARLQTSFCQEYVFDINFKDELGRTALSYAVSWWSDDAMWIMEYPGVDTVSADNDGHTPLWWAIHGRLAETTSHYSDRARPVNLLLTKARASPDPLAVQLLEEIIEKQYSTYSAFERRQFLEIKSLFDKHSAGCLEKLGN